MIDRGSADRRALSVQPALSVRPIRVLDDPAPDQVVDPASVILTCANCGAPMEERKCKLICRCGYSLSCSDYY